MRVLTDWQRGLMTGVLWASLIFLTLGCAVSAGGFHFSLLQDASVTLNTGSKDGDPNGPP